MNKKRIFIIMPFKEEFYEIYNKIKEKFETNYYVSNAGSDINQQNILKDIVQLIYDADVVIADLTGLNANVMYELGLAHGLTKKTIMITQDDLANLPFDLKQYRVKKYSTYFKYIDDLIDYLERALKGAFDKTINYSNPVNDFLIGEKNNIITDYNDTEVKIVEYGLDKGFLDYLADIEENSYKVVDHFTNIKTDAYNMSNDINNCTTEIVKVRSIGRNGIASFVRKEAKKIAGYINTFSEKLSNRNDEILNLWGKIEIDTLGLLENKFALNSENKPHLINYLKSLSKLKNDLNITKDSFCGLQETIESVKGLERSLNHSADTLMLKMGNLVDVVNKMQKSIDKILTKGNYYVGKIDDYK